MSYLQLSSHELVHQVDTKQNNPDQAAELIKEVYHRIIDPTRSDEIFKAFEIVLREEGVTPPKALESDALFSRRLEWKNCIDQQECFPKAIVRPRSCQDLIDYVHEGKNKKLRIRAVGSGHSFSNVCPTDGILVDPHSMNKVLRTEKETLRDPALASRLVTVESGITIKELNEKLNGMASAKALATMGAYDGQTLAGAISTGTHGSMVKQGPIASLVRSLVLVSEKGTVYKIEPSDGITDPSKFQPGPLNIVLKQDDDWFLSALVAMGCLGLIYAYTLDVVDSFLLKETRQLTSWQEFKSQLANGLSSPPLQHDYFELDINPYVTDDRNTAISVVRDIQPSGTMESGSRGLLNWLSGLLSVIPGAEWLLVGILNTWPQISPGIITRALHTLADSDYIAPSFMVFDIGAVDEVKAYAMELSFDATQDVVSIVDRVIAAFQKAELDHKWYIAGPVALRFVAPAAAYAAPQEGRPTMMVEMDMLAGIKTGPSLLKYLKESLCSGPEGAGVRVHWGLDLDTVTKDEVPKMFPQWEKWLGVYRQLNTTGMWNNAFTERIGIST
ncbi:hypothetical protein F5Y19DRAFT_454525 [Xylariaceae sp. FL1651]|nr:hypothetical protein F5Y19DRAFT_454525 [Xylariaceae sp. FL1651]